ncbi:MAG: DNA translocase FtsK 4TM domain-containing protein, partial [Pirellulaceae bacterium]
MLENRNLRLDLCAVILLAIVVFLSVSLLTYHSADQLGNVPRPWEALYRQDVLVYPQHDRIANACGWFGALAADVLFNAFGLVAYYFVASLAILDAVLLRRQRVDTPVLRGIGWLLSLFGLTAFLSLTFDGVTPGPVIGAGGYLGVLGRGLLETHFALAGGVILSVSVTLGGLFLSTDYALLRFWVRSAILASGAVSKGRQAIKRRKDDKAGRSGSPDKSSGADKPSGDVAPDNAPIRVRGKSRSDLELTSAAVPPSAPAPAPAASSKPTAPSPATEPEAEPANVDAENGAVPPPSDSEPVVKKRSKERPKGVTTPPHFEVTDFDKQQREAVMSTLDAASVEDPGDY